MNAAPVTIRFEFPGEDSLVVRAVGVPRSGDTVLLNGKLWEVGAVLWQIITPQGQDDLLVPRVYVRQYFAPEAPQ